MVSPRSGLNDEVAYRIDQKQVDYVDRKFEPSDLDGVDMVLTAVDDPEASSQIFKLCKERRIPANIADVPPECDFYFGSVHRDGPLQIMVSTNGNGPKLANIVRRQIAKNLPDNVGAAIVKVGQLRRKLRKVAPEIAEGPKRMQWYVSSIMQETVLELQANIMPTSGCPRCANRGAWKISATWTTTLWSACSDFMGPTLFRAFNNSVMETIRTLWASMDHLVLCEVLS